MTPPHRQPHDGENIRRNKTFQSVVTAIPSIKKRALFTTAVTALLSRSASVSDPHHLVDTEALKVHLSIYEDNIHIVFKVLFCGFLSLLGWYFFSEAGTTECYRMSKY